MANVNKPTDPAQRDKDINQKLQLFGIYEAFSNGKVPSNKQIDVALNSALTSKALASPSKKLSPEGQSLVTDLKEVIKQAKHLLLSKNEGNLIQEFVWDAQNVDASGAKAPNAPVDKETAKQHGDEALEGMKTLGRLLITNGQFRKLLNDAAVLARDMAGDAAQSAANKVNPDEAKLSQIDEPAEENTWHDTPDLSKDAIKQQVSDTYNKNKPFNKDEAANAAQAGLDAGQQHSTNTEGAQTGANVAADNLRATASENVPEETKENARKAKEVAAQKTKNYLSKKMPQERREQTIWRLKKMVVEIQGHSDYQQAINTLLTLAETYGSHSKSVSQQSAGTVKGAREDQSLAKMETNLRTIIERFANYTSADDLFESINQIYRDADQDPELKNWFKSLDKFVRKCLQEQGFILQDECNQEWNALYDKGRFLFRERYRDHTDHILDEVKFLGDQFDKDPQNQAFGQAMEKLFLDLGRDEDGTPKFKPHLIKDITEVIIPGIFENTRYVPIPRIEVSDPMVDVVVENLVIESDNLFPNVLELGSDNYWRLGRKQIKNQRENKVMIAGSGMQMDLKDVAYYIKKKQGFPSITDKGVMDIILAGEGFSFKIAARNAQQKDRNHFVAIDQVDVQIKNLQIKVKKSNHKLLFSIAKPLLLKVMRPVIQKVIEKQIRDNFAKADAFAWSVHQDVQRDMKVAKQNPEEAPNIYQAYVNAFQKKLAEGKKKAEQVANRGTEVKLAVTKDDSMFKNISLPGGISTKATEYKELAAKGERWESPVFSIGSAKESTDLPKSTAVSRKPHQTRAGGVRGGNHPSISAASGTTAASTGFAAEADQAFNHGTQAGNLTGAQAGGLAGTQASTTTGGSLIHDRVTS